MSRITTPPPSSAIPATRTARPSRRPLALFVACALLACTVAAVLAGCSNLGEFNESAVARQAESYYADKYGERVKVADLWEDRSYQLFGYRSSGQAFCTMEDGACVLVDFEEGALPRRRRRCRTATRKRGVYGLDRIHKRFLSGNRRLFGWGDFDPHLAERRGGVRGNRIVLLRTLHR